LKNDIQAIQEEKKEANKIQNTNKKWGYILWV
jgi:hypothetical protein